MLSSHRFVQTFASQRFGKQLWLMLALLVLFVANLLVVYPNAHATPYQAAEEVEYGDSKYGDSKYDVYLDTQDAGLAHAGEGYGGGGSYRDKSTFRHYQPPFEASGSYRQPVAIELMHDRLAIIPTRLSGEIFGFDPSTREVSLIAPADDQRRWGRCQRLSDAAFAVIDSAGDAVVVFQSSEEGWREVCCLPCPGLPNQLAWVAERGLLYVTGQWSQRLYRFQTTPELDRLDHWERLPPTDLPLHGGAVLPLPQHAATIVADAFGRDFVVLDLEGTQVIKRDQVYGHNIPSLLAVDGGKRIMYVHQLLNEFAQSTRGDMTWGGLLSNNIRWLQAERMLDPSVRGADIFSKSKFYPVGMTGDGAGDPTSLSLSSNGWLAVTVGGTSRVAFGRLDDLDLHQLNTGLRPIDCCFTPDNQQILVVNQFGDSLTIVTPATRTAEHVQLGPLRPPTQLERGEQLFFDSRLSHDGWMSCHSCHSQGHTSHQLNDNLTDGSFGTPKRILSLLGQAETAPYSWTGKFERLEDQVFHSIRSTMATDDFIPPQVVEDIASYVRSLPPPPALPAARQESLTPEQTTERELGKQLFASLGCAQCHAGDLLTTADVYDVGLVDEFGTSQFNPPSLIGVSQRQGLLHDGGAASVRDVIEVKQHQLTRELTSSEVTALVRFLESL